MIAKDIDHIVKIHQRAFKGFFLEQMGPIFLKNYYKYIYKYHGSIALVAQDDKKNILGFCVGFKNPSNFYKFFYSNKIQLIPSIFIGFLRRPKILISILRNIFRVNSEANIESNENQFELSSIGVDPNSKGIGGILLKEFIEIVRSKGSSEIVLTTNKFGNNKVHNFYKSHGFVEKEDIIRGERILKKFTLSICK